MILIELTCLAIVVGWLVFAAQRAPHPGRLVARWFVVAVAAWIGEDTCIRAYGFYSYSPEWHLFLDRVPILVVMIWPIVILSAYELSDNILGPFNRFAPLLGALFVLADAAFIEPIAVEAGLWVWHEPGFFGVPPIGVIGWALFAFACLAVFSLNDRFAVGGWADIEAILLGPVFTHSALIALWWSVFRGLEPPWYEGFAVLGAWVCGISASLFFRQKRISDRMAYAAVAGRIPAAWLFGVLVLLWGMDHPALVLYSLAFVPPYLMLMPDGPGWPPKWWERWVALPRGPAPD